MTKRAPTDSIGKANQSVERTFLILNLLTKSSAPLSAIEISALLKLNRTTTYGLLETLEILQFIEKLPNDSKYRLTTKLYEMGINYPKRQRIVQLSDSTMREAARRYQLTVSLGVLKQNSAVLPLVSASGDIELSSILQAGRELPIYATGMGKLFLADMDDSEARALLEGIERPAFTQHTITDLDTLLSLLPQVRKNGYAMDDREYLDNNGCISFPIRDDSGRVVAALSLSGLYKVITERKDTILSDMLPRVRYLSSLLGYQA